VGDIVGAPTTQVLCQYLQVWGLLRGVVLDSMQADRFVWKWSPDGKYSCLFLLPGLLQRLHVTAVADPGIKTYGASQQKLWDQTIHATVKLHWIRQNLWGQVAPQLLPTSATASLLGVAELWNTKVPPRVKFFFWLVLHRPLWTAERRKRHGLQEDDDCALCGQALETGEHLFLGCVTARELWFSLLALVGLSTLVPENDEDIASWWLRQRHRIDHSAQSAFDSLMLLICWSLWKERNNRTVARSAMGSLGLFPAVVAEAEDWVAASFSTLATACTLWSQNTGVM
jgi:hypothetical protein